MDENLKLVTLENNKVYIMLDEITNENITYVYLVNYDDEQDFCIRRLENKKSGKFLVGLKNDDEFDKALLLYSKKNS